MSSEINYNDLQIGQVLYIVSDKQTRVIPVVVSEQATIRTLEGNTTTWKVIIGPKEKRKTYSLDSISGEKFSSLEEAKNALLSRFTSFLNETIKSSEKITKDWYNIDLESNNSNKQNFIKRKEEQQEHFDTDSFLESMDEPTANVVTEQKKPIASFVKSMQENVRLDPSDSPEVRRAKLRAMVQAEINEEDIAVDFSTKTSKVILPGGEEVTVIVPNLG